MKGRKLKIKKENEDIHTDRETPLNIIKISKNEIVTSYKKNLTFYENNKEKNKIQLEEGIEDMIYLKDKSIALTLFSFIKILKKTQNNYQIHKKIDNIESVFLLNIENNLYAFGFYNIYTISLKNFSIISSNTIADKNKTDKYEGLNDRMRPFLIKSNNEKGYNICIRKYDILFFINHKTNKIVKQLNFDDIIDFVVTQKDEDKDKFYICLFNNFEKKINTIDIEIREYNYKFDIINKYIKKLIISSITETLYPYHICLKELLIINNQFYIFTHFLGELQRNEYQSYKLINFEGGQYKNIIYNDSYDEGISKELSYKFLIDENNKLIFALENELENINYEEYEVDSDDEYEEYSEKEEKEENQSDEYENGDESNSGEYSEDIEEESEEKNVKVTKKNKNKSGGGGMIGKKIKRKNNK